MSENYKGPERREYCAAHCQLNETAKKAVPRWAFLSSLGAIITLSIAFMGVNETRLSQMKTDSEQHMKTMAVNLDKRLLDQQIRYSEDAQRLYRVVADNSKILIELKTDMAKTIVKQDLVLRKIKIAE